MALIERYFDHLLSVGNLAPNAHVERLPLKIQENAPFALRGIAAYDSGLAGSSARSLAGAQIKFTAPDRQYLQSAKIGVLQASGPTMQALIPNGGRYAEFTPVYPQLVYPAGAVIELDCTNRGGLTYNDGKVMFRGVQLFEQGQVWSPTYPDCYQEVPQQYAFNYTIGGVKTLWRQAMRIESDADFVLRGLLIESDTGSPASGWRRLYMRLSDRNGQYYSNDFVHVEWMCSNIIGERPALVFPEIYIPAGELLYVDFQRNDPTNDVDLTFNLVLDGVSVYRT